MEKFLFFLDDHMGALVRSSKKNQTGFNRRKYNTQAELQLFKYTCSILRYSRAYDYLIVVLKTLRKFKDR